MHSKRKIYTIIFVSINVAAMAAILITSLVMKREDIMQMGYLICAVCCLLTIFLRLSRMNRLIFSGRISSYDYKKSDEYHEMKYENYSSLIAIALYIILVFAFTPLF